MCLFIFKNTLSNALLTEASQPSRAGQPSNANQNVHRHPHSQVSLPQQFYLFICQWAADFLACLAFFFFPRESHCFTFSNLILLSEAPTCLFLSGTELKNLSDLAFSGELPCDLSSGLRHVRAQRKRKQWPENQGQRCSAASTAPWMSSASFQNSFLKKTFWSKNSCERR